jgi:hypothetical protein
MRATATARASCLWRCGMMWCGMMWVMPPVCQQGEASEKLPPLPSTGALCVAFIRPSVNKARPLRSYHPSLPRGLCVSRSSARLSTRRGL